MSGRHLVVQVMCESEGPGPQPGLNAPSHVESREDLGLF